MTMSGPVHMDPVRACRENRTRQGQAEPIGADLRSPAATPLASPTFRFICSNEGDPMKQINFPLSALCSAALLLTVLMTAAARALG